MVTEQKCATEFALSVIEKIISSECTRESGKMVVDMSDTERVALFDEVFNDVLGRMIKGYHHHTPILVEGSSAGVVQTEQSGDPDLICDSDSGCELVGTAVEIWV